MTKSNSDHKTFRDTPVFAKKVYFEEESVDIGDKNNVLKVDVPTLTVFYVNQWRQTQKDLGKDVISYVNMKILAQVNRIKDPTPIEIEEAMNEDPRAMLCVPIQVMRGINFLVYRKSCLALPSWETVRIDFSTAVLPAKKKDLSSGYKRNKIRNPYSCTIPSSMKDPLRKIITTHQKDGKYTVTHLSFATVSRKQTNITSSLSFSLSKYVRRPLGTIFTHPTY